VATILRLSPDEASEGVTAPVEVPVRCLCRGCGGRGESWTESCLICSGSGTELFRHHVQITIPAGVCDGARFHFALAPRHQPSTRIELRILVS
jgi:DnaJ-class molecular chaperone